MREIGKVAEGTSNQITVLVTDLNYIVIMNNSEPVASCTTGNALELAKLLVEAATGEKK